MKKLLIVAIIVSGISLMSTSCEPEIVSPEDQNYINDTITYTNPIDDSNVNVGGGPSNNDTTWISDGNNGNTNDTTGTNTGSGNGGFTNDTTGAGGTYPNDTTAAGGN